jgi:putative nucleotidyltransferase with HDIG domain
MIEKIRKNVEESFLLSPDIREFLTVSVGAACSPEHGSQLEELISKAFEAVLDSKQSGRNKSILYNTSNNHIDGDLQQSVQSKIKEAYISSTYALAATIDAKDHYTYGHSNNVAELSVALAVELGFEGEDLQLIHNAGLLHDIGKVGIPESVLLKKGFLTTTEMDTMRSHVVQSINIIKHIPNLVDTIPIIISHHEKFDGQGYPRGISGENIPILGRVICIADAFDAMTTDRPYRKGLSVEQALYELKKHAGTQFDPQLVDLFVEMIKRGDLNQLKLENRPSY